LVGSAAAGPSCHVPCGPCTGGSGQVASWQRPRLVAKGDPDRDQTLATTLRQTIAELPQGAVVLAEVLAEDETH
jgi:hypothetical protein